MKSQRVYWMHWGVCACLVLAGCASVSSTPLLVENKTANGKRIGAHYPVRSSGGLIYYLPTQRLRLTLTVTKSNDKEASTRTIAVEGTVVEADLDRPYEARFVRSQTGKSKMTLTVTSGGLLNDESSGSTTPEIAAFAKSLAAATTGELNVEALDGGANKCAKPGTYVFELEPEESTNWPSSGRGAGASKNEESFEQLSLCGLLVKVDFRNSERFPDPTIIATSQAGRVAGFYYRQPLPIHVLIADVVENEQQDFHGSIVSARSPTHYLRIPGSVFADTDWKVKFANGTPTLVTLNSSSEVTGFLSLPAQVIAAYSDALLSGFKRRKTLGVEEAAYLNQLNALALAQAKRDACAAAIEAKDPNAADICK